ncbi:MAG: biotin-dependent carboxyltransferase family protein [Pseudomonadales bacterium]|nr:biotin-dependent carboxyltransferase family protein [Pseudomonadales bacterium]
MLKVIRAGLCSSIQDGGRQHVAHFGVCRAGALDCNAAALANCALQNAETEACLEITQGAFEIECLTNCWVCVTGQQLTLTLSPCDTQSNNYINEPIHAGWPIQLHKGQCLSIIPCADTGTAYLAVAGGFDVPVLLGSKSTDLGAQFGGFHGRTLQSGDTLALLAPSLQQQAFLQQRCGNLYGLTGIHQTPPSAVLRALPGPEEDKFSASTCDMFWQQPWQISPASNRMGCRLYRNTKEHNLNNNDSAQGIDSDNNNAMLNSHAIVPGTVQLPGSGEPIVLLADAQTTGGYPRIACVIQADLWQLAQLPSHARITFERCTRAEARQAFKKQRALIYRAQRAILHDPAISTHNA